MTIPEGCKDRKTLNAYHNRLVALIQDAHRDGIEIAGWLSEGISEASEQVGGVETLLVQRPGSWEAEHVRALDVSGLARS